MSIPLEVRIFFFACDFLWCVLSLYHYLDEEIATEDIGSLYLKWAAPHSDLAEWAGEERIFSIHSEQITKNEKDKLSSLSDTFGDSLIIYWGNAIKNVAIDMNQKYPEINESLWLYYHYCSFLHQVLTEFDEVLQNLASSPIYYEHYRQDISLFNDMAKALENERPFLDSTNVSEATVQVIWDEIDAYVVKLGAEWRQAVHSAARDLKLPDHFENAT